MSDVAIQVQGLGKRYRIGATRERYVALRDVLARKVKRLGRLFRSSPDDHPKTEDFWALRDVDFEVKRGECVGIIGRNGAGKSTLLKILSRITAPTTGEIRLKGRVGSLLEVGTGFNPELTGRENIFLNGAILGMGRKEISRKFDEIVEFAEVSKFLDTAVKYYSSGMYTRLAFAVAAHLEPEILIVDEVLAVGDMQFQQKCLGKMGEVSKSGRTVLFVSHNMAAIQQLCSEAILLRSGRVFSRGSISDVISSYLSDSVSNDQGIFDVSSHSARLQHFESVIRKIVMSTDEFGSRSVFRPQDSLCIELQMVLSKPVREARIAIAIEDRFGHRITTMANYFSSGKPMTLGGSVAVRCRMQQVNLGPGRYLISASIGERNQPLIDSIDCAAWFNVEWDNNYETGEQFNPVYGPVLSQSSWVVLGDTLASGNIE